MPKADGKTLAERFGGRYIVSLSGCWLWTAGKNGKGYGYIWTGPNRRGDTKQAYKVGWVLKYGPVPDGMELHHKCKNPLCVNPDHLELLTHKQHQLRHSNVLNNWRIALAKKRAGKNANKKGKVGYSV